MSHVTKARDSLNIRSRTLLSLSVYIIYRCILCLYLPFREESCRRALIKPHPPPVPYPEDATSRRLYVYFARVYYIRLLHKSRFT